MMNGVMELNAGNVIRNWDYKIHGVFYSIHYQSGYIRYVRRYKMNLPSEVLSREKDLRLTLRAYAQRHDNNNPDHNTLVYGNFTECVTCKDHAHYAAHMIMIRHNSDYSIHERVELKEIIK